MWTTSKVQRALELTVILCALALVALIAGASLAFAESQEVTAQPEVLIVEHTYDAIVEKAGTLIRYQYTGGRMLVEWTDTTADGIYRNGFE